MLAKKKFGIERGFLFDLFFSKSNNKMSTPAAATKPVSKSPVKSALLVLDEEFNGRLFRAHVCGDGYNSADKQTCSKAATLYNTQNNEDHSLRVVSDDQSPAGCSVGTSGLVFNSGSGSGEDAVLVCKRAQSFWTSVEGVIVIVCIVLLVLIFLIIIATVGKRRVVRDFYL